MVHKTYFIVCAYTPPHWPEEITPCLKVHTIRGIFEKEEDATACVKKLSSSDIYGDDFRAMLSRGKVMFIIQPIVVDDSGMRSFSRPSAHSDS